MMGLPEGHVTAPALGLTRNQQIKILGNGVVPAQCAAALRILLPHTGVDLDAGPETIGGEGMPDGIYGRGETVEVEPVEAIAIRNLYPLTGVVPWVGDPAAVEVDLIEEITSAINNHPRSLQKTLGPSELGVACTRRLLHKLNGDTEPRRSMPWLPTIGTAVHAWLAEVMENAIGQHLDPPRYLIEHRVMVGQVGGVDISGSSDLFDTLSGTVCDWKISGRGVIDDAKRKGPSRQYQTQAHLYGRGFANQGYQVNTVMLAFLPRNELSLSARYFWSEPYDERIAIAALDRAGALLALINAIGIDAALAMYGPCDDTRLCPYCSTPATPRLPATSTRELFAGSLKGISA